MRTKFTHEVTTSFDQSVHLFTSLKEAKDFVRIECRNNGLTADNFKIARHEIR